MRLTPWLSQWHELLAKLAACQVASPSPLSSRPSNVKMDHLAISRRVSSAAGAINILRDGREAVRGVMGGELAGKGVLGSGREIDYLAHLR